MKYLTLVAAITMTFSYHAQAMELSSDCRNFAHGVYVVALARDSGMPAKTALAKANKQVPSNIIAAVYKSKEFNPDQLRMFSLGLCTGAEQ